MNISDEQELISFTNQWDKAMTGNDAVEIGKFMSEDWVLIGSDGITTKASFLESVNSGVLTHSRMDADEMKVTMYENTGIIVALGTSAGTYLGEKFSLYEWSTSIFRKVNEKWLCVLTMLTPAKKPE